MVVVVVVEEVFCSDDVELDREIELMSSECLPPFIKKKWFN